MATLQSLLSARLTNLRSNPDGTFQARCPACAAANMDRKGEHLRVWPSHAFRCVVVPDDKDHNRAIRAFIHEGADSATLAALTAQIIDPEPQLVADKVYPEEMLSRLVPDHTYWVNRGISVDVLRRLEGGLAPADERSKLSGRYIFPIRDHVSRRIMGWTGRLVSDASFGPKHKHLVRSSRAIYPLTVTRDAILRARKVVLIESVGNQLSLMSGGIDIVLDLLGLNLNSRILGFLAGANLDECIISTDTDTARVHPVTGVVSHPGQDAAEKLKAKLVPYLGERVRIRQVTTAKDWCAAGEGKTGEIEVFKGELGL